VILASAEKIKDYTSRGWWGNETIDDRFRSNVARFGDKVALVDPPDRAAFTGGDVNRLTYTELDAAVTALAANMLRMGIRKGDVVVYQLPNIAETAIILLACARIGVVVSPLLVQFDANEIKQIVEKLKPKLFLSVSRFKARDLAGSARPYCEASNCKVAALDSEGEDILKPKPGDAELVSSYLDSAGITANDVVTVCWTSGTEGRPKGVPRSHNNWFFTGRSMTGATQLETGDVLLNIRPMVNMAAIGGSFMSWLFCAGKLVLHHPLTIPLALKQIREERVQISYLPPAFFVSLLGDAELQKQADLSSVRVLGTGSAAVPTWVIRKMESQYDLQIINFFGANEGTSLFARREEIPDPEYRARLFPRFGRQEFDWPNAKYATQSESRIVDLETETEISEPNRAGELRIKNPGVFEGYYDEPEMSAKSFDKQGFYKTGDLFEIAGDGDLSRFYRFVGRSKDIIVRGGLKISPSELDDLISQYDGIQEAAFFGYPDDRLGEKVGVAVVPKPGVEIELGDVTKFLKEKQVAIFKWPEKIVRMDQLPRNAMLKVQRNVLTEKYSSAAS
jgi:acyl-CoA synthetase (AMP-forming)/AMP-acid ligase II